ncbi:hypothetical protein IMF27_14910 [Pseudomonas sp. PCH199]|nr:hypothetical protein [Pseudomonas sp. PCH199]
MKILYWERNGFCLWLTRLNGVRAFYKSRLTPTTRPSC